MSNLRHLPKSLPSENPFFEIDVVGSVSGERYKGRFECQIPNLRIQANIDKYKRFLNGGMDATLDKNTLNLHHMTAYCKFTLVEAEKWFIESDWGYDLFDQNVLEEVYNQILAKEEKWLTGIWGDQVEEEEVKEDE